MAEFGQAAIPADDGEAQTEMVVGYRFVGPYAGFSVASAGDVDGDGLDDVLLANPYAEDRSGESLLVLSTDLAAADAADGVADGVIQVENLYGHSGSYIFIGNETNDNLGNSVSSAGDIDGDGLDDLIIGASGSGQIYLVAALNLTALDLADGSADNQIDVENIVSQAGSYIFTGTHNGTWDSHTVASAGDVDGDGLEDILIRGDSGSYLVLASDLAQADATDGLIDGKINVSNANGHSGSYHFIGPDGLARYTLASAGDVDGDGLDDIFIGAPYANTTGLASGEAFLILSADLQSADAADGLTDGTINLESVKNQSNSYQFVGGDVNDNVGISVASVGDVDGDGLEDLIIGAWGASGGDASLASSGGAFLLLAADLSAADAADGDLDGVIDLGNINGHSGSMQFIGADAGDGAGISVSSAGDVDGDGREDLLIGAYFADGGGNSSGEAYLILAADLLAADAADGVADGIISLGVVNAQNGSYQFIGAEPNDFLGISVASAGDVDGDGLDDLIIGSHTADAYLVFASELVEADLADGTEDGIINFASFNTLPNLAPTISVSDQIVTPGETLALSDILTVNDPDATLGATNSYSVEIRDDTGSDNFWYAGEFIDASSGFVAQDLSKVLIQADSVQTTQTLWVRVYDGYDWSAWDAFTLTSDAGPGWFFGWYIDAPGWAWTYGWHVDWTWGSFIDWDYGWHIDWSMGWSYDWDWGWHIDWAYGWTVDWAWGWHIDWAYGWHVDWAYGWSVDWDYGWHFDWGWVWAPGSGWLAGWVWDYGWSWAWDFGWSWSWDYGWSWAWDYGWSWSWAFGWSWAWDYGWSGSWSYGWTWSWDYGWSWAWDYGWSWSWDLGWAWAWLSQPDWVYGPYYGWDFGSYGYSYDYYEWAGWV